MSTLVAVVLFVAVTAYAVFGGADFGAGFWDLVAGGAARGYALVWVIVAATRQSARGEPALPNAIGSGGPVPVLRLGIAG